jgi:hypothetical protein
LSRLNLAVGVAAGFSFKSGGPSCNEVFCTLPEMTLLLTPTLKAVLPLSDILSATIEGRGAILTGGKKQTYPFQSGFIIAIGIEGVMGS